MNFSLRHTWEFIVDGVRSITFARMGWAFLLAWVFSVFYTSVLGGVSSEYTSANDPLAAFYSVLPVSASVITLVVVVLIEKRVGSPTQSKSVFYAAPALAGLFTPLLFLGSVDTPLLAAAYIAGGVGTGVGSGVLWVMWGEYYTRITQENVEYLAPASAFAAALMAIVVSSMQGWVPLVLVSAMPMVSGEGRVFAWREVAGSESANDMADAASRLAQTRAHSTARTELGRVLGAMGRACFGILVACLLICVEGGLFSHASDVGNVQIALCLALLFMLLVGVSAISGPRRVSLAFLYRWMCPILVVGFACVIIFGQQTGLLVAYVVTISARFAFCLITQMYFARYASAGLATPVQAYGLGWISVHLGDALGVLAIAYVNWGVTTAAFTIEQVAAFCAAALVICTMFVLNDEGSFDSLDTGVVAAPLATEAAEEDAKDTTAVTAQSGEPAPVDEEAALDARVAELARQAKLTPRELEVFGLLARGRSVPYIRDALVISRETAATHTKHIYAKLDVHSRQELIDLVH